jgi:hypothetical protein
MLLLSQLLDTGVAFDENYLATLRRDYHLSQGNQLGSLDPGEAPSDLRSRERRGCAGGGGRVASTHSVQCEVEDIDVEHPASLDATLRRQG